MIMKQFLLEKINMFTTDVLNKFTLSVTNNLPIDTQSLMMWGREETGFWYLDKQSAYFFENDGTFHIIDTERNETFYNSLVTLYEENEKLNIIRMSKPLEFDTLSLENDAHAFGLPNGQVLYYNKFVTPTGEYGMTWELIKLTGNSVNEASYTATDQITAFMGLCKKLNVGFYYLEDANPVLLDNDGYFLFMPSPNTDIDIDNLLSKAYSEITDPSFIEYGKHKFYEQT